MMMTMTSGGMGKVLFTPFWSWLSTHSCEIHPEIIQILVIL